MLPALQTGSHIPLWMPPPAPADFCQNPLQGTDTTWGVAMPDPAQGEGAALASDLGAPAEVRKAAGELLPLFYDDVRRMARRERRRAGHWAEGETLQTTALINEAYLKLRRSGSFADQGHFLRAAALAMRHVLIDYARERIAVKRGGGITVVPLTTSTEMHAAAETSPDQNLLEIDAALGRLAALSPRLAQVVECRFFAGYDEAQTAQALGIADRTVRRDWVKARAWLQEEMRSVHQ